MTKKMDEPVASQNVVQTTMFDVPERKTYRWPTKLPPRKKKVFLLPSETVPGQSASPSELVGKHAQGVLLGSIKTPMFDDLNVSMGINPKTLDMLDLQQMVNTNRVAIDTLSAQMFEAEQELLRDKRQAEILEAKRQQKLDELLETPKP